MVSIVIPNWNGARHIEVCLGSLERQTYKDFELIFVDNDSKDNSVEIVKQQFPKARVVILKGNRGFARAANEGIKVSRGDYIALLNNDTETDPHWLEKLLEGIKRSEAIGMCASKIIQFDDRSKLDTAGDGYTKFGISIKRGHNQAGEKCQTEEFVFGACAAAALYRRSLFDATGYFDEDFFCIYEDVDLSFRAQLAGYRCLYVPTATVYHRIGGTSGRDNAITVYYGQRNMESVFLKNMPFPLLMKYLPFHVAYLFFALIYNGLRKHGGIFLRSKVDALKQIRLTIRKRKIFQVK
jgi:GT2 family glycosyltransferase